MNSPPIVLHGAALAAVPLLLDSPHSGRDFPADFDAAVSEFDLREGEDCYVDELYAPAAELGAPLLAALFPRTYLDPNRHHGDIDLDLIEGGQWPHEHVPSGKARDGDPGDHLRQRHLLREPPAPSSTGGDRAMTDRWWDELGLGSAEFWRDWTTGWSDARGASDGAAHRMAP